MSEFNKVEHLPALEQFIEDAYVYAVAHPPKAGNPNHALRVLHGVNMQAIRHSAAFMTLRRTMFSREADVCARAALEHSVTAQWAYFSRDGVDRLANSVEADMKQYYTLVGEWLDD